MSVWGTKRNKRQELVFLDLGLLANLTSFSATLFNG